MGMMQAVELFFKRYADFNGRSGPAEYWWVILFHLLLGMAAGAIFIVASMAGEAGALLGGLILIVWVLYGLATIVPSIAVIVRRLHDKNRSGWLYLAFFVAMIIPLVNLVAVVVFIVFMCQAGDPRPNQYGPSPDGRGIAEEFR